MVVAVVVCLLFAAGSQCAHADEASKRAKIKEMFVVIHLQGTIDQMLTQQEAQMRKVIPSLMPAGAKLTEDQQKDIDGLIVRTEQIMRESVNWQKLEPQYLDLYASTYSEEEVDGMLAFYRSPVGSSMIAKQPEIITKSQSITQTSLQEAMPKLQKLIVDFAAEQMQKAKAAGAPQK